jgi:hypothetical protein
MHDIVVRAYDRVGNCALLAVIPVSFDSDASEAEVIAKAMILLRSLGRFSDTEIESFKYRFERYPERLVHSPGVNHGRAIQK